MRPAYRQTCLRDSSNVDENKKAGESFGSGFPAHPSFPPVMLRCESMSWSMNSVTRKNQHAFVYGGKLSGRPSAEEWKETIST